ncbi:MAG: polysaccharide biosynthesis tyrosine autokinase [Bacteroidales bacterium]|nr:polysaccharide biosynthesis tyrosine autokinase [Bacteroidales bacterium]
MNTTPEFKVQYIDVKDNTKINYALISRKILSYWRVLLIAAVIGIGCAYLYNSFTTPIYNVSTTVLFRDQNEELSGSPDILPGLGLFNASQNFYNEVSILNSYPIILKALSNLNFDVSYYVTENFVEKQLYQTSPFIVVFNPGFPQPVQLKFEVNILSDEEYEIKAKGTDIQLYNFSEQKVTQLIPQIRVNERAKFGEEIGNENFRFKIIPNSKLEIEDVYQKKYAFELNNLQSLATYYKNVLQISLNNELSTVATVELRGSNVNKSIDFLKSLTNEYVSSNLNKKNHIAKSTINYINNQLEEIADSLSFAEDELATFRASHQVINVDVKAEQIYMQLQTLNSEKAALTVSYKYYTYIKDQFENQENISELIAPSSMGIDDPLLGNLVQSFVEMNSEKNTLIENRQQRSPYLRQLEIKIENLKNTIYENIIYHLNTTDINLEDINQRIKSLNQELNKLPETERRLLGMERNFNLNDAIYTFLLQRRAEAQIALASNLPNTEIVEPPRMIGKGPVLPRKKINYLIGLFLGIVLPGSIITIRELLVNTVYSRDELSQITKFPVIGTIITKPKGKSDKIVLENPGLPIAECFRKVTANLNYFSKGSQQQVIMVTSSVSGEGKSFCAFSLASVLAIGGRKTILIGFDMRKPEFYDDLGFVEQNGLSSVLTNQSLLEDTIAETDNENLHVLPPGNVPPNPTELIASKETIDLLENLKDSYEIIIIDTPPIGILADAVHLLELADVKIFVVRFNYTRKNVLENTLHDLELKKLKNLALLMNDVKHSSSSYGYNYKYYKSRKKKGFMSKLSGR